MLIEQKVLQGIGVLARLWQEFSGVALRENSCKKNLVEKEQPQNSAVCFEQNTNFAPKDTPLGMQKVGNTRKKEENKKWKFSFFSVENNRMSTSLGKKLVTL